jgi:hypothetical protein
LACCGAIMGRFYDTPIVASRRAWGLDGGK